jgi:hypothetical protein
MRIENMNYIYTLIFLKYTFKLDFFFFQNFIKKMQLIPLFFFLIKRAGVEDEQWLFYLDITIIVFIHCELPNRHFFKSNWVISCPMQVAILFGCDHSSIYLLWVTPPTLPQVQLNYLLSEAHHDINENQNDLR